MPELPDLTVFSDNLTSKLKGKKVRSAEYHKDKRLNVSPEELQNALTNSHLDSAERSGKEIQFKFSNGATLLVHLMLSGGFAISKTPEFVKFRVLTIFFDDDTALVVSDPKGLVTVNLNSKPMAVPDALDIDGDYLRRKISEKPKLLAKAFLIDQAIIRGIGNAYADEILWAARISPKSVIGKIPGSEIDVLLNAIRTVLLDAIDEIRKANPDIISGEVREFLKVHNPDRQQSPSGRPIIKEQVASKSTYFTDEQVLYT